MSLPMKGWKTWLGIVALIVNGINELVNGDASQAMLMFSAAWTALGIGAKVEKATV